MKRGKSERNKWEGRGGEAQLPSAHSRSGINQPFTLLSLQIYPQLSSAQLSPSKHFSTLTLLTLLTFPPFFVFLFF